MLGGLGLSWVDSLVGLVLDCLVWLCCFGGDCLVGDRIVLACGFVWLLLWFEDLCWLPLLGWLLVVCLFVDLLLADSDLFA